MKNILLLVLVIAFCELKSQDADSISEFSFSNSQQIIENFFKEENFDKNDDIINDYSYANSNKSNLNTCSKEELISLNILSVFQVNNLLNYREQNGEIFSFFELNSIHGIEKEDIEKLRLHFSILPESEDKFRISNMSRYLKKGKHQLLLRGQSLIEDQRAYTDSMQYYRGNRLRIYHNYRFSYNKLIRFGYTFEKDPGESFSISIKKPQPWDFASAYLEINRIWVFNKIIVGDFKLEFGQGLNKWTSYAPSKSSSNINRIRFSKGGLAYTGSNESNYLRGLFNEIVLGNLSIASYASYLKSDARFIEENNSFKLLTTGLHRSESELKNRHNLAKKDFGIRLKYTFSKASIGLNIANTVFSDKISAGDELYQSDFKISDNFLNASFDYLINLNNILLSGEFASDSDRNLAYIGNAVISYHNLSLFLSLRNYSNNYTSINSNPFSEYTNINEKAFFAGIESEVHRYLKVKGHIDIFENTWFQYNKNFPEKGYEYQIELRSDLSRSTKLIFLYRNQQKFKKALSADNISYYGLPETRSSYRISIQSELNTYLSMKTLFETVQLSSIGKKSSFLAYQEFTVKLNSINTKISLRATSYNTPDWDTRIYTYERDLLYTMSFPVYYDKGNSFYLLASKRFGEHISLWLKYSRRIFDYKDTISSGAEEINDNTKSEIKLQIRIKF